MIYGYQDIDGRRVCGPSAFALSHAVASIEAKHTPVDSRVIRLMISRTERAVLFSRKQKENS